jgi:hypothetical protein
LLPHPVSILDQIFRPDRFRPDAPADRVADPPRLRLVRPPAAGAVDGRFFGGDSIFRINSSLVMITSRLPEEALRMTEIRFGKNSPCRES